MKMESRSKKILITGIDGFTGIYLEGYLCSRGFDVYGTVLDNPKQENYFICDITKNYQVDEVISKIKPDYIVHMAAISFVEQSSASLFYDVNVIGTQNILEAVIRNNLNPKKIILASSATVYGNQSREILDEAMCPKPVNHYGCSKLSMENISANYFNKLNIIITRPFNYTGVGQAEHFLIPKIVKHFKEGKKEIELGNIDVAREFNSVNFITQAYCKLLLSNAKSMVVNLSSGEPIELKEIIYMMQDIAGYKIKIKINPTFIRENEIKSLAGSTKRLNSIIESQKNNNLYSTLLEMFKS